MGYQPILAKMSTKLFFSCFRRRPESERSGVERMLSFSGMSHELPNETIEQVTNRTEGWLVGLQLLGFSLSRQTDLCNLLQEVNGNQRYILDYLMEEVLRQQP